MIKTVEHALIAPGQGNQKIGMGRDLALRSPAAAAVWSEVDNALLPELHNKLTELVWYGTEAQLTKTAIAQPAVIVDALARKAALEEMGQLENSWWNAGNSLGFITALRSSGSLNFDGAIRLSQGRGEAFKYAIDHSPRTTMTALVNLHPDYIKELLEKYGLEVCLRNPGQVVMGGEVKNIDGLDMENGLSFLRKELGEHTFQEKVTPLNVDAAFHSRFMKAAVPLYQEVVDGINITPPAEGMLLVGGSGGAKQLINPADIRRELVSQITETEDWESVVYFLKDQGVITLTELNGSSRLTRMNSRTFPGGLTSRISLNSNGDKGLVVAYRWISPDAVIAGGSGEKISREEVASWMLQLISNRTDTAIGESDEELNENTSFENTIMDSEDMKWLRSQTQAFTGKTVPDEEAAKNLTIREAINSVYKLLNS